MKQKLTRSFRMLTAYLCWYSLFPVHKALAASRELNLEAVEDPQAIPMPSMVELFLKLVVSLVIIAGLAYLTVKFLRKNMKVHSRGANIKVLDHYAFSLNKGIYITEIAGKVYVLGVTDHSISLVNEVVDPNTISDLVQQAQERDEEPIIPPGILERIMPGFSRQPAAGKTSFNVHIQKQISKLQSMVENRGGGSRNDDKISKRDDLND